MAWTQFCKGIYNQYWIKLVRKAHNCISLRRSTFCYRRSKGRWKYALIISQHIFIVISQNAFQRLARQLRWFRGWRVRNIV